MPDTRIGNQFRNDLKEYIISWNEDIEILEEKPVGWRFVGIPRKKLVTSGIGLELEYDPSAPNGKRLTDPYEIFRQRFYIELGLDWFKLFKDKGTT
ncbi:MAG: hypothetical protein ACPL68_06495 [Candidatus Hydrothermia bacterium]